MNDAAKRNFAKTLLANDDMKESCNAFIAKAKEDASDDEKPVAKKKNRNVTVLPSIAVFNGRAGGPPILPVTLDGNLPTVTSSQVAMTTTTLSQFLSLSLIRELALLLDGSSTGKLLY